MVSLRALAGLSLALLIASCGDDEVATPPEAQEQPAAEPAPALPQEEVPGTEDIPDDPEAASTVEPSMIVETARCVIGPGRYDGPCTFVPQVNGTFSVARADESPLYGEVAVVTVAVVGPGIAEVRGLTTSGVNSRWGRAERSARDPACWQGTDFSVCAY